MDPTVSISGQHEQEQILRVQLSSKALIPAASPGTNQLRNYDCKHRSFIVNSTGYNDEMVADLSPVFKSFRCWNATAHPAPTITTSTRTTTSPPPCTDAGGCEIIGISSYATSSSVASPPDCESPGLCSAIAAKNTPAM